jgi:hypothetical protein
VRPRAESNHAAAPHEEALNRTAGGELANSARAASRLAPRPTIVRHNRPDCGECLLLITDDMTQISRRLARFATFLVQSIGRVATLIVGFVMMVVGLAMAVTLVMLPMGIIVGLIGAGVFVCGVFAPTAWTQ